MYIDNMVEYLCLNNILKCIPDWAIDEYVCGKRKEFNFGHENKIFNLEEMMNRYLELRGKLLEPYALNSDSKE